MVRSCSYIQLDTGEKIWLNRSDLNEGGFSEGQEVDEPSFQQFVLLHQYPRALNLAVSMLARRPCSKGEIHSRLLHRRFTGEVADLVVCKLEKEKLLDDEDFCEQWIRFRISGHYGPSAIRRELLMKGIPSGMIESVFERLQISDVQEHALVLAQKAWKRIRPGEDIRKSRQKVIASVVRKGFSWDTAKSACEAAEKNR